MKRKANSDSVMDNLIFIIIVIAFFAVMFIFVNRVGSQASIIEQTYSKKIALVIDRAKPGTTIIMDISNVFLTAEKNKYNGKLLVIDNNNHFVEVHGVSGKGYKYEYFSNVLVEWEIKNEQLIMYIK